MKIILLIGSIPFSQTALIVSSLKFFTIWNMVISSC